MGTRNPSLPLVLVALGLASCGLARDHAPARRGAATPAPASEPVGALGEQAKQEHAPAGLPERKIIRNGEIMLLVDSLEQARDAIEEGARGAGGYLSSAQTDHGDAASATLTLRVPAARFDDVARALARLGKVLHESLQAEEITEQYYDLAARLANARRLESRLLELVAQHTAKVSDLLEVERELGRVREDIERLEGKKRLLDSQVALGTLTVHLTMRTREVASAALGTEMRETLSASWQALSAAGRGLLLAAVALLPWSPFLIGGGWLLVHRVRRRRMAASVRSG